MTFLVHMKILAWSSTALTLALLAASPYAGAAGMRSVTVVNRDTGAASVLFSNDKGGVPAIVEPGASRTFSLPDVPLSIRVTTSACGHVVHNLTTTNRPMTVTFGPACRVVE